METKRCYGCMKLKTESPVCEHCGYDENTANASHQLSAGTVLKEQYLVGRVLGQGGFGITYLGWDLYLDIPVAIKEYFPSGTVMRECSLSNEVLSCGGDSETRFRSNKERFLREAKMLARFSRVPEIVQVRNFFLANNTAYIVMEYVEGITLKEYVRRKGGKLSVEETLSLLRPVTEALCKVHKTGLVHRDISPDNIMMLPQGGIKLLDFGAVRDVGTAALGKDLTSSTEAILKPGYAPIEQYQKRGNLGPWTDVYALCGTIYYCLTGESPADAPERLLEDEDLHLSRLVPELTESQRQALEHGLAIRAENRTVSMDGLLEELFPAEQEAMKPEPPREEPPREEPPKPETPEPQPKKKGFGKLLGAVAMLLVLVGVVAVLLYEPLSEEFGFGLCGSAITWDLNEETGTLVIQGAGNMDNYGREEENRAPWYDRRLEILSVTIGDAITSVGDNAFADCVNLTEVTLGRKVERIGCSAFENCGFTGIDLPDSLRLIDESAFRGACLTEIRFPAGLEYVELGAFENCPDLRKVVTGGEALQFNYDTWQGRTFSNGIDGLNEDFALYGSTNSMTEDYARIWDIPFVAVNEGAWETQGQCGDGLSWYLDRDTGLLLIEGAGDMWDFNGEWYADNGIEPDPNRDMVPWAPFREEIRVLSIGDGVTYIGENAFEICGNLVDVHWGETLRSIGFQAFLAAGVDQVVLPDSVTNIESCAFNWCESLTQVVLPEDLAVLRETAFADCVNLTELYVGLETQIEDSEAQPFHNNEEGAPENLTIYGLQFSAAETYANENGIPFSIGYRGMTSDAEGQCGDDAWWFKAGDTLMIYGTGETWMYDLSQSDIEDWAKEEYEAGRAYTSLAEFHAYANEIYSVKVLPGIETLNNGLFRDMFRIREIDFGTVVNCRSHFHGCSSLREVVLPETVKTVGSYLFYGCENLESVTILGGSGGIETMIFSYTPSLRSVTFGRYARIQDTWQEGLFQDQLHGFAPNEELVFYVYQGSDAQRYAMKENISYEIIR